MTLDAEADLPKATILANDLLRCRRPCFWTLRTCCRGGCRKRHRCLPASKLLIPRQALGRPCNIGNPLRQRWLRRPPTISCNASPMPCTQPQSRIARKLLCNARARRPSKASAPTRPWIAVRQRRGCALCSRGSRRRPPARTMPPTVKIEAPGALGRGCFRPRGGLNKSPTTRLAEAEPGGCR